MFVTVQHDSRLRADKTAMVRLSLYRHRIVRVPLGIWVTRSQWDKGARRVRFGPTTPNARLLNNRIQLAIDTAQAAILENPTKDEAFIRDLVIEALQLGGIPKEATVSWADANDERVKRLRAQGDIAEDTEYNWLSLNGLVRTRYGNPKLYEMGKEAMGKMRVIMVKKGLKNSSISGYLKRICSAHRSLCKERGLKYPDDMLEDFKVEREIGDVDIIPPVDIDKLIAYRGPAAHPYMQMGVDVWLLGLYQGGARSRDILSLRVDELPGGRIRYITNKRKKTKDMVLLPQAQEILKRYKGVPYVFLGEEEPTLTVRRKLNSAINAALKKVAKECGITGRLHIHNQRHSFAAWARYKGVPDAMIQSIMGITDKVWANYSRELPNPLRDAALQQVFARDPE